MRKLSLRKILSVMKLFQCKYTFNIDIISYIIIKVTLTNSRAYFEYESTKNNVSLFHVIRNIYTYENPVLTEQVNLQ